MRAWQVRLVQAAAAICAVGTAATGSPWPVLLVLPVLLWALWRAGFDMDRRP